MSSIANYLDEVQNTFKTGIAREHAYRPALKTLLETAAEGLNAVNDPKQTQIGMPDFQVLQVSNNVSIGVVEAKDIGVSLDQTERSNQMERYYKFGNVILTDYLEFRWYIGTEEQMRVRVAEVDGKNIRTDPDQYKKLEHLLSNFALQQLPTVRSARELAEHMAALAQEMRYFIQADLDSDDPSPQVVHQLEAFKRTLLPGLDHARFADMVAQTIAYGLFAARVNHQGDPTTFTRYRAAEDIPRTNPFLRKLFHNMGFDLGDRLTWLVDTLVDLLVRTDTDEVLRDFGRKTRQEDPVVHFYETFLAEYDPQMRERRGVYYTPEPVVSYIVRSVDHILRTTFERKQGLADKNTLVLDPATGTGTFLYFVIQHIYEQMAGQRGTWSKYVKEHLLTRLFGFELLMAPYTIAHMKLGIQLQESGYDMANDQRLGIYLTNTLEEGIEKPDTPFGQFISDEANEAVRVKRIEPIMVVLGNPPYSGHSENRSESIDNISKGTSYIVGWEPNPNGGAMPKFQKAKKNLQNVKQPTFIGRLTRDYYFVDGNYLNERNPKWLNNDYVKFIRFGQWRIEETGSGVLAFITDNSYLDSITFRGMRQRLMQTFTDIYILNLHGNSRKQETAPDGSPDDPVFDIQQGVAIALFVKEADKVGVAKVHHLDIYGKRTDKYRWLFENEINSTNWATLKPSSPYYLFTPHNIELEKEYMIWWKITDIMTSSVVGFQTHRDKVAIAFLENDLQKQVYEYLGRDPKSEDWQQFYTDIDYRPFDSRKAYLSSEVADRPRHDIIKHILDKNNFVLNLVRQTKNDYWEHVLVSDKPTPAVFIEIKDGSSMFPLYLYPDKQQSELFTTGAWPLSAKGRRPNLNPAFVDEMAERLGLEFVSEGSGLALTPGPSPQRFAGRGEVDDASYRAMASKAMVEMARDLRQRQTTAEEIMWEALRNRRLGSLKFRRQHPIANTAYVVDFLCYEARLVVEIDGGIHREQIEDDTIRQANIEAEGYRVLRFDNTAVMNHLEDVLAEIAAALTPDPSPQRFAGRGEADGLGIGSDDQNAGEVPSPSDEGTVGRGDLGVRAFGPEDIFHYAYAVFHSPTYRERYAEFLKIDFPRLPLTSDVALFADLCQLGAELVALHLMTHPALDQPMTTYPEDGDHVVESGYPKYDAAKERVTINKTQYFDGVPEAVWEFHVGGYQVLEKWLKDRRGRELSFDDLEHYQRIVVALSGTMEIMESIDEAIPDWPIS